MNGKNSDCVLDRHYKVLTKRKSSRKLKVTTKLKAIESFSPGPELNAIFVMFHNVKRNGEMVRRL